MKLNRVIHKMFLMVGVDLFAHKEDRRVLVKIMRHIAGDARYKRILFVGCDYYTKPYTTVFSRESLWTLEVIPERRKYGARNHIVDTLEHLDRHVDEAFFDAIICNGVFGWGLNDPSAVDLAFGMCHRSLRKDGLFLLGWDDIPEKTPVPLDEIASLKLFQPKVFEPLETSRYLTNTPYRHTYLFLTNPAVI